MKIKQFFAGLGHFLVLWSSQAVSSLGTAMTGYALILWVYAQKGTATSIALLSLCTFAPSILLSFAAGTLADKWDKRRTMLVSDLIAAAATAAVMILYSNEALLIWHLYLINILLSIAGAFQNPASYVAVSLLVPKEQYHRVSGLQGFSGSLIQILAPVLATTMLTFSGLKAVLLTDLFSFAFAFLPLLFYIRIPDMAVEKKQKGIPFVRRSTEGINFLRSHKILARLILYMALINLLAYSTGYGILPAMILSRSGNDQAVLGLVSSAMGVGLMAGSLLVTVIRPPKSRTRLIFQTMFFSFAAGDILWGLGGSPILWILAGFGGFFLVPLTTAGMSVIMRTHVPMPMQGRVFAARDTLQYFTIPIALGLSGILADRVFEPFMRGASPVQAALSILVGSGKGAGMALMFLLTGIVGCAASLVQLKNPAYRTFDTEPEA